MSDVGREIIDAPSREDIWNTAVRAMGEVQARCWVKTARPHLDGKSPNLCIEEDPARVYEFVSQMSTEKR